MTTTRVHSVPGMSCDHCVKAIPAPVTPSGGVTGLVVDLDGKTVTVTGGDDVAVVAAIDEAGFDVA